MQLCPVKGRRVYGEPKEYQNKALFNSEEDNLWNNCQSIVLKTNHRQGEHSPWKDTLNRIRVGEQNEKDKELLESRRTKNFPEKNFDNAIHGYFTNLEVENWNTLRLNTLQTPMVYSRAVIDAPQAFTPTIKDYGTVEDTNMMQELKIKVGARVMLIQNISVADSLVNGVTGVVLEVLWNIRKGISPTIRAVVVKFDNPNVGDQMRTQYRDLSTSIRDQNGVPIFYHTLETEISGKKSNLKHGSTYKVTQIPLRLGYAFTAHKLQGVTLKRGTDMICHGHKQVKRGMIYVMLSRCESIDNVFLADNVDLNKIKCDIPALFETQRLEQIDQVPISKKQKFDIFYLNIYSLNNKLDDLLNDIEPMQSDIICLVETWLQPGTQMTWPNKQFHDASVGKGNGVCIFRPHGNEYQIVTTIAKPNYQMISMTIIKDAPIQLFLLYLSQNASLDEVTESIKKAILPKFNVMCLGDFNQDKHITNSLTRYLKEIGLTQLIQEPTHKKGNTIDHFYVPVRWKDSMNIQARFLYYSDHISLSIEFM